MIQVPQAQNPFAQGYIMAQEMNRNAMQNWLMSQTNPSQARATIASNNATAQYAQPMGLARLNLARAQAQGMLTPKVTPYNNFQQLYTEWQSAPSGSPRKIALGKMLDNTTAPKGGLSVQSTPDGGFSVTQGGQVVPNGQGAQSGGYFAGLSQLPSPNGTQPAQGASQAYVPGQGQGMFKLPTGTNSRYSGGGAVYGDTAGNKLVVDTKKQQGQDMQQIAALQRVIPQLNSLQKTVSDTQGTWPAIKSWGEGLINKVTDNSVLPSNMQTNFQLPSEYANRDATISNSAEGLIKAFGLNPTDKNLDAMKESIQPQSGESPQGYTKRILGQLLELKGFGKQATNRIVNGMTFDKNGDLVLPQWAQMEGSEAQNVSRDTSSSTIKIQAPNGKIYSVPESEADDAIKAGGKKVG